MKHLTINIVGIAVASYGLITAITCVISYIALPLLFIGLIILAANNDILV